MGIDRKCFQARGAFGSKFNRAINHHPLLKKDVYDELSEAQRLELRMTFHAKGDFNFTKETKTMTVSEVVACKGFWEEAPFPICARCQL